MHVVVAREQLARGISAVLRAVSARGPLPILTHFKVVADPDAVRPSGVETPGRGVLIFMATDLEIGLTAHVPADVREAGAIALPAKTLGDIVAKLPNADVDLTGKPDSTDVTLKCQRAKFNLRGLPAAEFPELPAPNEDATPITLDAGDLAKGIRQTLYAAGGEDKAVIAGLLTEVKDDSLELAATDGFRLAWKRNGVAGMPGNLSVVVPRRAMDELSRQLGAAGDSQVTIRTAASQVSFELSDRFMTSRLLDGAYPPYRNIIPKTFEKEAVVDRASLLAAVERVAIMAFDREAHTIKLDFGDHNVSLTASSSEMGASDEAIPIEYAGEPLTISFNAHFLVDALKSLDTDTVRVSMNGTLLPALLRPLGSDDQLCLLMPINRP